MAKLFVSSGKRGRPLSIDPEAELHKLVFQSIPKAQARLKEFRASTSGVRDVKLLGSEVELPSAFETTRDVLQNLIEGESVSYETLKELKQNLRQAEMLGSKQERVFGRALEEGLTKEYFSSLDYFSRASSKFTKESNERVKEMLSKLTPQQRQKAFFSRGYQDPATMMSDSDRRVLAWARKHSGNQELTVEEAWAYLREQRWKENLSEI